MNILICHEFLACEDEHEARQERDLQIPERIALFIVQAAVTEIQDQEDIDEALPRRQGIGIMESVPDIVQDIDGKTGEEKDQDKGVY